MNVVNAVLLKVRLKLYQSRYHSSAFKVNQDTTHLALNATQKHNRRYLTSYYEPGYNPPGS